MTLEGAAQDFLIDLQEIILAESRARHTIPRIEEDQAEEAVAAGAEAEEMIPRPPAIAGQERSSHTWLPEPLTVLWSRPLNRN
jgi:hypothetical protein